MKGLNLETLPSDDLWQLYEWVGRLLTKQLTSDKHKLDVGFQEVVHSALTGNSEVAKPPAIRGEPNGHPQECRPDA
jgi:hypothetical protein